MIVNVWSQRIKVYAGIVLGVGVVSFIYVLANGNNIRVQWYSLIDACLFMGVGAIGLRAAYNNSLIAAKQYLWGLITVFVISLVSTIVQMILVDTILDSVVDQYCDENDWSEASDECIDFKDYYETVVWATLIATLVLTIGCCLGFIACARAYVAELGHSYSPIFTSPYAPVVEGYQQPAVYVTSSPQGYGAVHPPSPYTNYSTQPGVYPNYGTQPNVYPPPPAYTADPIFPAPNTYAPPNYTQQNVYPTQPNEV